VRVADFFLNVGIRIEFLMTAQRMGRQTFA
jgi:hypothetical protein